MGLRTAERLRTTERTTNDPEFAELDALRRVGILTEIEYRDAREKLQARHQFDLLPTPQDTPTAQDTPTEPAVAARPHESALPHPAVPRHAAARGRHAKQPSRWPWIAGSVAVLAAAVAVGILLRPAAHPAHPQRHAAAPPQSASHSPAIVVASPANTPMTINLDGSDAQVAVSRLVAAPAAKTGAAMKTYTATVTIAGQTGTFAVDPTEFSANSESGRSYGVAATPYTTLRTTTVGAGQHATGAIAFTVPATEHIAVVLFTTPLGEQLGLWSTS